MSNASGRTPSLTPSPSSRSPTPEPPIQPDHFYGSENAQQLPPSPDSDGRTWLDPEDDPLAQRGIPVFKPTMEQFEDFEAYLNKIECWGMKSGIVKVIPPKEWTDALPSITNQLSQVKLKTPIEQHMLGRGGLFRQENMEKRRILSVREWSELCSKEELRAPGVDDIGLHARAMNGSAKPRTRRSRRKRESETAEPDPEANEIKEEEDEAPANLGHDGGSASLASPPSSVGAPASPHDNEHDTQLEHGSVAAEDHGMGGASNSAIVSHLPTEDSKMDNEDNDEKPPSKGKRSTQTRKSREANLAERAEKDKVFMETFDPHSDWLPPNTTPFDYTPDFCRELERRYWRNCGLGKPAWYGADMAGSLFTEETKSWNVANLYSTLSRLLPTSSKGLPGVNTPYLYFGMWRATFAWHVEDMDLFSINYVHFGAPKYWYAIPQARASALEQTMRGYFPKDVSNCSQFLRHKSFLASPTLLSSSSCRPNTLVQHAGEFVITFPKGYHAGFNLGFNCAESVNFALDSWLDIGRKAKACGCVNFSVRIDVDQLLRDREAERVQAESSKPRRLKPVSKSQKEAKSKVPRKRPIEAEDGHPKPKKQKTNKSAKNDNTTSEASSSKVTTKAVPAKVTLKLGPKPKESDTFPCCLCVSPSRENLLRVQDPPVWRLPQSDGGPITDLTNVAWMAHENCANVIPETWVDNVEVGDSREDGTRAKERVVFGVDAIVKDRWNLKCTACTKTRHKAHGAPIQCTKGKCPKAFHVSCAREGSSNSIVYKELREVEKEVVLLDPQGDPMPQRPSAETATVPVILGDSSVTMLDPTLQAPSAPTADGVTSSRVLKLIRKIEVQVLCSQHNPAVAEAKRATKQEKIRNDLLALPPMSRIKLRVSAGVFEVSLIRVIEESSSVEVLWDRGVKREFKWGSVVFGNTEGLTVGQKPTEAAPEPEQLVPSRPPSHAGPSYPLSDTAAQTTDQRQMIKPVPVSAPVPPAPSAPMPAQHPQPPAYPSHAPNYHYPSTTWRYQYTQPNNNSSYGVPGPSAHNYSYAPAAGSFYQNPPSYPAYGGYHYSTPTQQTQGRELQWQRPYTGPKPAMSSCTTGPMTQTVPYYGYPHSMSSTAPNVTHPYPWQGHNVPAIAPAAASVAPTTASSTSTTLSTSASPP